MSKQAAIYARISETGRDRDKVADQVAQCRRLAVRRGYEVSEVFTDDGISALGGRRRPGFEALLDGIRAGRFETVLATEEERFARNVEEKAVLQAECIAAGVVWETERDGFVDPANEAGEFFSTMRAAMGRMESRRKASRQRAANLEKAAEGRPVPGRRRFGYETDGVTPRDSEAVVVRRMFQHVADGGSIRSLVLALLEEGVDPAPGRTWRPGRVRDILSNPHYAGEVRHLGQVTPSSHVQPIVDPALAAEVRAILADPTRRTTPGPAVRHLASGLAHCGVCGETMFFMRAYRCRADTSHPSIVKSRLDPVIRDEVAKALLAGGPGLFPSSSGANVVALVEAYERNAALVDQLITDRDEGLVPPPIVRARLIDLRAARESIEADLERARTEKGANAALLEIAQGLLGDATSWSISEFSVMKEALLRRFDALDLDRQREVVRALLYVEVRPGRAADRVRVEHILARHLNPEFMEASDFV